MADLLSGITHLAYNLSTLKYFKTLSFGKIRYFISSLNVNNFKLNLLS